MPLTAARPCVRGSTLVPTSPHLHPSPPAAVTPTQEYVGGYVTSDTGHLEFRDGLLVDALRRGHWIILDGACRP